MMSTIKTNHTSTPIALCCCKQTQIAIKLTCEALELTVHIPLFPHSVKT